MTPTTLTAIRSILGSHFSEARAKALYRVVLEGVREEGLTASRDHAPTSGAALEWRTIDSAPRDGTSVLILIDGDVHQGSYDGPSDGAIYSGSSSRYNWFSESAGQTHHDQGVTHWMPIPAPPSSAEPVEVKAPGMPSKLSEEEVG